MNIVYILSKNYTLKSIQTRLDPVAAEVKNEAVKDTLKLLNLDLVFP